jgi:hypothetical protein
VYFTRSREDTKRPPPAEPPHRPAHAA